MATYLTIDNGNSSSKIALWQDDIPQEIGTGERVSEDDAEVIVRICNHFDAVCCCSVGPDITPALDVIRRHCRHFYMVDADLNMPLSLRGYSSAIGADRIAAACGAIALHPGEEMLVVDYGTAITYDHVGSDGAFLGGNIAAGTALRLRALHAHTARLPKLAPEGECPDWGSDTESAMRAGAVRGVVAELLWYRSILPEGTRIVVTGGAAHTILPHLPFPVTEDRDLVLTGLKCIIDYNEKF